MKPYYTTWSPSRGGCGHKHKHHDTAQRCVARDVRHNIARSIWYAVARSIWYVEGPGKILLAKTSLQVIEASTVEAIMGGTPLARGGVVEVGSKGGEWG